MISLKNLLNEQYGRIDSLLILATTIVLEAGGEGDNGMLAVAHVISNRAKENHNGWGSRPVQQAIRPYQFSMWNDFTAGSETLLHVINRAKQGWPKQWPYAEKLAKMVYSGTLPKNTDATKGAVYYYNPKTANSDSLGFTRDPNYVKTATIGKHVFGVINKPNDEKKKEANKKAKLYTVKPGETLGGIANRNNTTIANIVSKNPGLKPDAVRIGQQIKI